MKVELEYRVVDELEAGDGVAFDGQLARKVEKSQAHMIAGLHYDVGDKIIIKTSSISE